MKYLRLAVLPLSALILFGCSTGESSVHPTCLPQVTKTMTLQASYIYGVETDSTTGKELATLAFDGGLFDFDVGLSGYKNIYAGDQLTLTYTGEIISQETYPSRMTLDGTLVSTQLKRAEVSRVIIYDAVFTVRQLDEYHFLDEHVIYEDGSFTTIDDYYTDDPLYFTMDPKGEDEQGKPLVAGIYAYKPIHGEEETK